MKWLKDAFLEDGWLSTMGTGCKYAQLAQSCVQKKMHIPSGLQQPPSLCPWDFPIRMLECSLFPPPGPSLESEPWSITVLAGGFLQLWSTWEAHRETVSRVCQLSAERRDVLLSGYFWAYVGFRTQKSQAGRWYQAPIIFPSGLPSLCGRRPSLEGPVNSPAVSTHLCPLSRSIFVK